MSFPVSMVISVYFLPISVVRETGKPPNAYIKKRELITAGGCLRALMAMRAWIGQSEGDDA